MSDEAVAALKGRRKRDATPPNPPPVTVEEAVAGRGLTRRHPLLFDPAELPVVVESSGFVPGSKLDRYVVAEQAAHEQVLADGCTTPIVRILWMAGQHVRRDVYEAHLAAQRQRAAEANVAEG